MKKNVGISIYKCLKSAAKNRRANQTARAILSAPTVCVSGRPLFVVVLEWAPIPLPLPIGVYRYMCIR